MSRAHAGAFVAGAGKPTGTAACHGNVVRTYRHTDPTTASDRLRIRDARAEVRAAIRAVPGGAMDAEQAIFRMEIGTNVRSVSPFALSLARSQGETIDSLVERMKPGPRWPRAPALSERPAILFRREREPYRRFVAGTPAGDREAFRRRGFGHGVAFMQSRDDWACVEVADHSIEVEARIGPVRIETLFGVLRVELDHPIPDTLAAACVGRSVCEIVDHAALRGHNWPIASVEEPPMPTLGQTLVVETGSVAYRMPWMR